MFPIRGMRRGSVEHSSEEMTPSRSRLESIRRPISRLFSGNSRVGSIREHDAEDEPESPKTPRPTLGLHNLPSTRFNLPYLSRTNTRASSRHSSPLSSPRSIRHPLTPTRSRAGRPSTSSQREQVPPVPTLFSQARTTSGRRFQGVDPAEMHLAELAESGRRRRKRKSKRRLHGWRTHVKNRRIRGTILKCLISGLLLTMILAIYLALALSNRNESQMFHVLLILIILITTVFFCHSLIRLCMMIINPPSDDEPRDTDIPEMLGHGGYANPIVPIRVALARDEEAAGIENNATKFPPPAYGLWRESVRMDPNRIYWQRNEEASPSRQTSQRSTPSRSRPGTARPPSYISEDGVDYVLEAEPRSIAPTTEVPLPLHPSERGRLPVWPLPSSR